MGGCYTQAVFRMRFQEVCLHLELFRICPEIVPFTDRDIFPAGHSEHFRKGIVGQSPAEMIELQNERDHLSGIFPAVFPDNLTRTVRGSIVPYNDFIREIRLLSDHAVKALPDIFLMVIRRAQHADEALIFPVQSVHSPRFLFRFLRGSRPGRPSESRGSQSGRCG